MKHAAPKSCKLDHTLTMIIPRGAQLSFFPIVWMLRSWEVFIFVFTACTLTNIHTDRHTPPAEFSQTSHRHQIVSFPCVQARSLALLLQSEISMVPQGALAWPVVAPALAEAPTREQDWVRAFTDSVILSPSLLPISLTSQLDPTPPPSPSPIYPCSTLVYSVNTPVHLHRSFVTL